MTKTTRQWTGTTSGSSWMHRSLIQMLRFLPLRFMYGFAAVFVLPFCIAFNRKPVKAISQYFKGRHGLRGSKLALAVWKSHYLMMQVVIDRFAAYGGTRFRYELEGNEAFKELESQPEGFILLTSHVGNSEMVGYSLGSSIKPMSALVYAGEAASVMENRRRLLEQHNIHMIPVNETLDHLFMINEALANGNIVGMPADRIIGSQKVFDTTFLNTPTKFPLGPFATAVQRDVAAVAVFMMKESAKQYRLIVRPIKLDEQEQASLNRRERMVAMGRKYAAALDEVVKRYPCQWFNYYDFWNELNDNNE
ncbi:MAG: lysophospholipid acyltransferase family protein [Muribaculaceae bacterium]|nr:lysophospholipid acyltransferase family protein [Muribaculaceae bacterium]